MSKELQEKDFIQDSLRKNPQPAWLWLVVITCIAAVMWGSGSWYSKFMVKETAQSPFLQVTNRQLSIFLWQFPEHMRVNSSSKASYLTGFQYDTKVNLILSEADKYVAAPPELLFLYHTWNRLVQSEVVYRSIPVGDFKQFLEYAEEWQPKYWPAAPQSYSKLVESLSQKETAFDLNTLAESELPLEVRQAFQGWKNYFNEGDAINAVQPTVEQVKQFLAKCPHYARNFWRNIMVSSYPEYLKSTIDSSQKETIIASNELAPFFRVAFYNYMEAQKVNQKQ